MKKSAVVMFLIFMGACATGKEKPYFAQTPDEIFQDEQVVELAHAAMKGDAEKINELIESGVDVNSKGKGGLNPLTFAMLAQNLRGFEALLGRGADATQQYADGKSVVHYAAVSDLAGQEFMASLIKHGVDLNETGTNRIPIFEAVFDDSLPRLKMMIDAGSKIEWKDFSGDTPLLHAAGMRQWAAVSLLLENGANYNVKDRWGNGLDYFFKTDMENSALIKDKDYYKALDKYCSHGGQKPVCSYLE